MHLIYIDDSRDEEICVFSALAISSDRWNDALKSVRDFRRELKQSDEIYVYKEFHAWKFVSGKGKISPRIINRDRRCEIFKEVLSLVAQLPNARLFNAVFPKKELAKAFETKPHSQNHGSLGEPGHFNLR